jgi:C-methyltransferase
VSTTIDTPAPTSPVPAAAPVLAPGSRLKELALGLGHAAMLHTAARLRIADALGDEPASATDLARAVDADPDTMNRLLRGLSTLGVFAEAGPGRYAHTDVSRLLRTGVPGSMVDMVLWAGAAWAWAAWPRLESAVRTGEPVVPALYGKDFFTYLREDGGADGAVFNRAMTQSSALTSDAVAGALDLPEGASVADIGGGQGHLLRTLLERNPTVHGILFDLPPVLADADPALREGGPLAGRCRLVPGDCRAAVPVEADVYVVKHVLKWDFESSVRALSNIRTAARPGARVVVVQNVVDASPEPTVSAAMDLMLLLNVGGREHTVAEFEELFRRAGLVPAGVTATRTPLRLVEATVPGPGR